MYLESWPRIQECMSLRKKTYLKKSKISTKNPFIFCRFPYSKMTTEANNTSFTNVFGELAQNTGMHGLPNIYRSGSLTRKTVWTIILIAGLGKLIIIIK